MTRATRTTVVLLFSIGTAAAATVGVYRTAAPEAASGPKETARRVMVAARPLPLGHVIQPEDVRAVHWPAEAPLAGTFQDERSVIGRGIVAATLAHEPLIEGKLAPLGAGGGLPPAIPSGMRAISVKVNDVIGVAGFVVPGTRVDVLATLRGAHHDPVTRVVVSDAHVLTAGTRHEQGQTRDGKSSSASVVTLAVTPQDAERIALAATEGQVVLALRNPLDRNTTATPGVRLAALAGTTPAARSTSRTEPASRSPRHTAAAVPAASRPYVVEAIRAAKRTEEIVR